MVEVESGVGPLIVKKCVFGRVNDVSIPLLFFFQAEDGIRDWSVTGVQTCALPILGFSKKTDE